MTLIYRPAKLQAGSNEERDGDGQRTRQWRRALGLPGNERLDSVSGAATALVVGYLATGPHEPHMIVENGVMRPEEGPAARLWQLLMVLQPPAMAYFAVSWLPRDPKRTAAMLALQALAVVGAALPVFLLES